MSQLNDAGWTAVGRRSDLVPGTGVGALYARRQIAIFWLPELYDLIFAVDNYCPISGVNIIARGIVGDIEGEPVVASPLYKKHFSLEDGRCLEQPEHQLETWAVRLIGDEVQVAARTDAHMAA